MDANDYETLSSFECGIECGNRIKDSDYIWCISSRDGGLLIKNTKEKYGVSSPYHNFGIASNVPKNALMIANSTVITEFYIFYI